MQPDVSVVIAAYNAMPYVVECVESVLQQTLPRERIEIVVVDDGSTDGTAEALELLAARASTVRVVHQPNSGGPAGPRNRAIDLSTGRYVFVLDADDYLGVQALERMVHVADEYGTDVVVGRMKGVGGRDVPKWVFEHTEPRTTVFESRAFRTLGPWKMYRREFLDRIGLRFPEDLQMAEDQPFVAHAYFNAGAISILGDYDYLYLRYREDRQNMTFRYASADANVPSLSRVFEIVERYVPPGADRDRFAARLFLIEGMRSVLMRLPAERDAAVVERVLGEARGWVSRYYNDEVARQLPWRHRVCYEAVRHGSDDEILSALDGMVQGADFKLFHTLDGIEWRDGTLVVVGRAGLAGLTARQDVDVELVARGRGPAYRLRAACEPEADGACRFEARLAPAKLACGAPLREGRWDAFIEVRYHGLHRRDRLGAVTSEGVDRVPATSNVELPWWAYSRVTAYFARGAGNLVLLVRAPVSGRERVSEWAVRQLRRLRRR